MSTGDLALVLLSGEKNHVAYLEGHELASLLMAMVDNGLVVTLILDCCFSASVYRHDDASIRFLPYDAEIDSKCSVQREERPRDRNGYSIYRDASMLPNWLINPGRYATLTACGPHEKAIEPKINGQRHGALSYFLLQVLEKIGPTNRVKDIYDHLRAKFQSSTLPQNPVLYGNKNQGFFGPANSNLAAAAIPIIKRQDGILELQAGLGHGVNNGDQLVLYTLGSAGGSPGSQGHSVDAKVAHVRGLTSDLELSNEFSTHIRTGWMAEARTRLSLKKFPVKIAPNLADRDEWLRTLNDRSLIVHVETDKHPSTFEVILNDNGEYNILDERGQKTPNLPSMPQDQTRIGQIIHVLEHLARFRLVKDLANDTPAVSFRESFNVRIVSNGKSFGPDCLIEVEHDSVAHLIVENRGDKVLYVFVYDLGPCWQVENVDRGTYTVVMPPNDTAWSKNTTEKKLRMKIPGKMKEEGYSSCNDIVKVFITSQPTSYDLLELPRLGGQARRGGTNRASQDRGDGLEDWAAMNFPIRTFVKADTAS
ncbi:hypothetical protein FALCPG4_015192 [Fusarium falciforme]